MKFVLGQTVEALENGFSPNKAGHNRATSCAGLATLRSARLYRRRYVSIARLQGSTYGK
jgi:hypothetical protein